MQTSLSSREIALARKLAATLHLNVEERQELPMGAVRMSAIVAAIDDALHETPFFPPQFRPGDGFTLVLERRGDGSLWMHEQHEIGVGRHSAVRTTRLRSIADAAQLYIRSQGNTEIDGVPIMWHA